MERKDQQLQGDAEGELKAEGQQTERNKEETAQKERR